MYKPLFNTVIVEIDDKDAKWGSGNDDAMLGQSYREGIVVDIGKYIPTKDYPLINDLVDIWLLNAKGKHIMWNEGVEAGTVFEDESKQYAMIYWWDIRAVKQ